jgi:hypothetical protein
MQETQGTLSSIKGARPDTQNVLMSEQAQGLGEKKGLNAPFLLFGLI